MDIKTQTDNSLVIKKNSANRIKKTDLQKVISTFVEYNYQSSLLKIRNLQCTYKLQSHYCLMC